MSFSWVTRFLRSLVPTAGGRGTTMRGKGEGPAVRPTLEPCPAADEPGPEEGTDLPDLRAVLVELAAGGARLRQDGTPFQKESGRFLPLLAPLPDWLTAMYHLAPPRRLEIALHWARRLRLVRGKKEGSAHWLELSEAGRSWLALPAEGQYAHVCAALREAAPADDAEFFWGQQYHDEWFLGAPVSSVPAAGRRERRAWGEPLTPAQRRPLREALFAAFAALEPATFYRLDHFVAHACFGPHNPLLLGRRPDQVCVRVHGRLLAPQELGDVAGRVLGLLVGNRLVPLGGLQAGRAADGELLIARRPRLAVYFGHDVPAAEAPPDAVAATRVVVLADFSVIVIGVDLSPLAELAPFCERVGGGGGGAVTLRLTRASVVRGVVAGLSADEIVQRLRRLAGVPLPGNVEHEVRAWAGWVRSVAAEPALLLRCPDVAAAERALAALGRAAERVNEMTLAVARGRLSDADRRKLLEHGIVVGRDGPAAPREKKKRRRR